MVPSPLPVIKDIKTAKTPQFAHPRNEVPKKTKKTKKNIKKQKKTKKTCFKTIKTRLLKKRFLCNPSLNNTTDECNRQSAILVTTCSLYLSWLP
jgi:hypothetical protein